MAKKAKRRQYKSGPKKGQFMSNRAIAAQRSGGRKKKRNPGRSVAKRAAAPKRRAAPSRAAPKRRRAAQSRAPARRRPARRNPRRVNIMKSITDGSVEAVQILIGKAAARSLPDLIGAPKEGNIGLAVQAATALVSGYIAGMFLSPNASRAILAGGLTAPLETLIVAYQIPWLSQALSPVSAANTLGAYARRGLGWSGMGAYAKRRPAPILIEERGMTGYVSSADRGIGIGYEGE